MIWWCKLLAFTVHSPCCPHSRCFCCILFKISSTLELYWLPFMTSSSSPQAISELSKSLKFAFNPRFGFITFCPSNLGTTLRASVHARVPMLSLLPNFKVKQVMYAWPNHSSFLLSGTKCSWWFQWHFLLFIFVLLPSIRFPLDFAIFVPISRQ